MKKTISFALMMCAATGLAASKEVKTTVDEQKNVAVDTKIDKYTRTQVVTRYDGSRANREDKKINFDVSILGLAFGTNSVGASVGKYLNNDTILKIEYSSLQSADSSFSDDSKEEEEIWDQDGEGYALSIGAKIFTGNSFYIEPSAYYRKQTDINSTSTFSDGISEEVIDVEREDITDAGIGFKIGNQWQFSSFTLGCDWVGVTRTLAVLDYKVDGDKRKDYETSLSLLNFYVGASF